jgi:DNA polymerase/3'-5' exonuclease PolX
LFSIVSVELIISSALFVYKKRKSTRVGCRSAKKKRRLQLGSTNQELVEMFDKLSSLETDQWKGYNFNVIAGRLRDIDFEIVKNDPNVFEMLKDVKGIGASTLEQIQEYLSTGSMSRIKELETDPKCVAMKKMMDIWGVGRVKVRFSL